MRNRRPGYDRIYDLVQKYDDLPPDERMQMSESHLIESYVQPMFETLGWSVEREGHNIAIGERVFRIDLVLVHHGLRVPVEVKKPIGHQASETDDSLRAYASVSDMSWGILTGFENIHLWDFRDPNHPSLYVETSPWHYLTDEREEHGLLAAEIFYAKLVQPAPAQPAGLVELEQMVSDPGQIIAEVQDGNLTPTEALAIARLHPNTAERAEELVRLSTYLPDLEREQVFQEALEAVRTIEDRETQSEVLIELASHLPE
ncbi:unnamed protein product, partial [marine sediment metagenome]